MEDEQAMQSPSTEDEMLLSGTAHLMGTAAKQQEARLHYDASGNELATETDNVSSATLTPLLTPMGESQWNSCGMSDWNSASLSASMRSDIQHQDALPRVGSMSDEQSVHALQDGTDDGSGTHGSAEGDHSYTIDQPMRSATDDNRHNKNSLSAVLATLESSVAPTTNSTAGKKSSERSSDAGSSAISRPPDGTHVHLTHSSVNRGRLMQKRKGTDFFCTPRKASRLSSILDPSKPDNDDDDAITLDTSVSGHSAYSLARRAQKYTDMEVDVKEEDVEEKENIVPIADGEGFIEYDDGASDIYRRHRRTQVPTYGGRKDSAPGRSSAEGAAPEGGRVDRRPNRDRESSTYSMSRSPSTQSMLSMRRTADISGSPRVRNMFETEPLGDRVDDLSLSPQRGISLPGGNATAGGNRRVRFEQDFDANSMNSQLCPTRSREQSAEVDDEVILAVAYRSGKVGAAYYSVMTGRLYLMEDMQENNQYELIRLLKFQVCPAIILTSARSEDDFIDALSGADGLSTECEVQARPSTEFAYQNARNKLLSLRLLGQQTFPSDQGEPENTGQRSLGRKTRLSLLAESIVSLNCREMVGCAGALLDYIGKARLTGAIMESGGHRMEVEDIEQFKLDQFMHVNVDCLWSLQIFQDDAHPNMHLYTKGRKEGLSLFGILNNTKTPLGRSLLRLWFLRPSMDIEVIQQRHDAIAFFLRPDVWNVTDQLRLCLRHIKNIPKILRKIRTQASVQEWQCLLKFSYNALKIRSLLSELEEAQRIAVVHKINETFIISILKDVGSCINNVIDFDTSLDEQRFVVKAGVDQDLDELKRTYHGLDSLLSEVAAEISTTIPSEFANQINVIYFPQLGYLITIPLKTGMREQEDFEVEGLYFQFCTASTVYYKSERMFELDETIGDIHSMIVDREIEIMQKLQETILTFSEALDVSAGVTAELDCILSLADAAKKHNYVRPRMTEEPVLEIKQGRHPLHELCADIFIANDTMLGDGEEAPRMMLLTGANFSGKSVYLKQIALITYMAQIGSFVPAESALIGIADKILTRVHTRETVSKMQSTFMTDLNQVGLAIRNSTRRSLVVLDEFGKGTDATDGVSLFCAVLEEFFSRGVECPRLVSATHFHEIFNFELLRAPPTMLKEYTTEIIETHGEQGLTYLYRIKPGRATSSWGVKCAALAGMPEQILQTAQTAADQLARGEKISVPQTAEDKQRDLGAQNVVKFFMTLDCANDSLAPLWELARTVSS